VSAETGKPCVSLLQDEYAPGMTMPQLLLSMRMFLTDPNPNPGVNAEAAALYKEDRAKFDAAVRAHCQKHAGAPGGGGGGGGGGEGGAA
jgi:ubiquitin-conjugating enzyme E2 D/E